MLVCLSIRMYELENSCMNFHRLYNGEFYYDLSMYLQFVKIVQQH
jgi:hypothetical protein